jgi:hypothetical protein
MNKYTAEDARFLFFTEEEAGDVSFDENDDFVEQNEEFSDEISESEDFQQYEKTYTELRTIQTTLHTNLLDQNQNVTENAQSFFNSNNEFELVRPIQRSETRVLGFVETGSSDYFSSNNQNNMDFVSNYGINSTISTTTTSQITSSCLINAGSNSTRKRLRTRDGSLDQNRPNKQTNQNSHFISKNNHVWHDKPNYPNSIEPNALFSSLTDNVLHLSTIEEFFSFFINEEMCSKILNYTNKRLRGNQDPITLHELKAFFGNNFSFDYLKERN